MAKPAFCDQPFAKVGLMEHQKLLPVGVIALLKSAGIGRWMLLRLIFHEFAAIMGIHPFSRGLMDGPARAVSIMRKAN